MQSNNNTTTTTTTSFTSNTMNIAPKDWTINETKAWLVKFKEDFPKSKDIDYSDLECAGPVLIIIPESYFTSLQYGNILYSQLQSLINQPPPHSDFKRKFEDMNSEIQQLKKYKETSDSTTKEI
ncbi:hypothetical protein DLAC_04811 [Tieghemostelium lacteum]|uniref:Uncharacterized protein n=1 Tax=Tieghemostelium lacteum TaxID=361077 RepID=A0A151ZKH2_TIELA|nr:hypothetical protein DLAC_04811 [Tieghemostelium lacteum]|eukprot:KYQ94502.1 hypothetical protein DLAC_04811 [Tieghemostelium lacteum]